MKINRLIAACAMLAAITVLPAYAQRTATAPQAAAPQTGAGGGGPIGDSKVAVIFTRAFLDPKNGITKINIIASNLDREFEPRRKELQGLQSRAQALNDEIT